MMKNKNIIHSSLVTLMLQSSLGCSNSIKNIPIERRFQNIQQEVVAPDIQGNLPVSIGGIDPRYARKVVLLDGESYSDFIEKGKKVVFIYMEGDFNSEKAYPYLEEYARNHINIGFGMLDVHKNHRFWAYENLERARSGKREAWAPSVLVFLDGKEIGYSGDSLNYRDLDEEIARHFRD